MRFLLIVFVSLMVAGCGPTKPAFTRLDGRAISQPQIEADKVICQGELSKAWLSANNAGFYRNEAAIEVFDGCMTQRGYRVERPR